MPELPRNMAQRFMADHGLPEYDASQLTQSQATAAYFEAATAVCGQPKLVANWVMGELSRRLNAAELGIDACPVPAGALGQLIARVQDGTLSNNAARQVLEVLWGEPGTAVDAVIEAKGLKQVNDSSALAPIVDEVLAANPKNVAEYQAGNAKALNALVGQIMKRSAGRANPQQVGELLRARLGA
jgi:aspartyl-tRNA(Asn)/glutamyl-tRNA(Gln) amidotransferase subunit B